MGVRISGIRVHRRRRLVSSECHSGEGRRMILTPAIMRSAGTSRQDKIVRTSLYESCKRVSKSEIWWLTWMEGIIATQTAKVALILEAEERKLARRTMEQIAFKNADSMKTTERML